MSDSHSAILRLQCVIDKVRENIAEHLRLNEPHSMAGDDAHLGLILPVRVNGSEAKADDAVVHPAFGNHIAEHNRGLLAGQVYDEPLRQRIDVAGFNNHVIAHQKFPSLKNAILRGPVEGVEP